MNIIYIHTHDSGRYISPYGHALPSPGLMRFAEEGTLFRQAYNCGPTCSPSRAALLTGMVPHSAGMLGLAHRGFELNDYSRHLAAFLKKNGYATALCGIQHEAPKEKVHELGYDFIYKSANPDARLADYDTAEQACAWLKQKHDKPFFLSAGFFNTHRPFPEPGHDFSPDRILPPGCLPDTESVRRDMCGYAASLKIADECTGRVLDSLQKNGLRGSTLVFFTTDHGMAFPYMKCSLFDGGIGVSLIMDFPGNSCRGKVLDSLVSHIDIFPTICDLAGIKRPDYLQGVSLLPLFSNEKKEVRSEIFSEVTFHAAYEPIRAVRTSRYKYIRYFEDYNGIVPANIDSGYSKTFLLENGLLQQGHDQELLFDLYFDPAEKNNLLYHEKYRNILGDLSDRMENWMRATGDPLLDGKIKIPAGAKVNRRDSIHPQDNDFIKE